MSLSWLKYLDKKNTKKNKHKAQKSIPERYSYGDTGVGVVMVCAFILDLLVNNNNNNNNTTTTTTTTNNNNNSRIEMRNSRFFTISSLRREPSPTRTLRWPERNRV